MVKFALAGAGKTIGKAIHNYLLERDSYDYIILSRTATDDGRTVAVDYSDIEAMAKVLDEHKIHTVISTVSIAHEEGGKSQMNLIEAAIKSSTVQRFMPSEFGARYTEKYSSLLSTPNTGEKEILTHTRWIQVMPIYAWKFKAIDRLAESRLEYTLLSNAMFMDYSFSPRIPSAFPEAEFSWIDFENNIASIPGDGNSAFVLTHSNDIPKFVMKVLELPRWETRYSLIGDRITFNQYVDLVEKTKGVKFEKVFNSVADLEQGNVRLLESMKKTLPDGIDSSSIGRLMGGLGLQIVNGDLNLPYRNEGVVLNDLFPELETLKIEKALKIYFSKGQ